jgi:hypothetical protein
MDVFAVWSQAEHDEFERATQPMSSVDPRDW